MSWIEFHSSNRDDPRLEKLKKDLQLSRPYLLGHLALLWAWASAERMRAFTGELSAFSPEAIAEAADYKGDCIRFVKGLVDAHYISRDPEAPEIKPGEALEGHAAIPSWTDFCGEPIKKRIERQVAAGGGSQADADFFDTLISPDGVTSKNPVWSLFLVFKYIKKDRDKKAVKEDKRWDNLNSSQLRSIKKILHAYEGDIKQAAKAVIEIGEKYEKIGCFWDASTVHRRLTDWEEGRFGS